MLSDDLRRALMESLDDRTQYLSTAIKEIEIVINYMCMASQHKPDEPLDAFMNGVGIESPQYLRAEVKMKHVLHVLLILNFAQAVSLMKHGQVRSRY